MGADVAGHGMLRAQHQPAARADAVPANTIAPHRHRLLESSAENTQVCAACPFCLGFLNLFS